MFVTVTEKGHDAMRDAPTPLNDPQYELMDAIEMFPDAEITDAEELRIAEELMTQGYLAEV